MNWAAWVLVIYMVVSIFATIAMIGKARTIVTPLSAAISVAIGAGLVWLIVLAATL